MLSNGQNLRLSVSFQLFDQSLPVFHSYDPFVSISCPSSCLKLYLWLFHVSDSIFMIFLYPVLSSSCLRFHFWSFYIRLCFLILRIRVLLSDSYISDYIFRSFCPRLFPILISGYTFDLSVPNNTSFILCIRSCFLKLSGFGHSWIISSDFLSDSEMLPVRWSSCTRLRLLSAFSLKYTELSVLL